MITVPYKKPTDHVIVIEYSSALMYKFSVAHTRLSRDIFEELVKKDDW